MDKLRNIKLHNIIGQDLLPIYIAWTEDYETKDHLKPLTYLLNYYYGGHQRLTVSKREIFRYIVDNFDDYFDDIEKWINPIRGNNLKEDMKRIEYMKYTKAKKKYLQEFKCHQKK